MSAISKHKDTKQQWCVELCTPTRLALQLYKANLGVIHDRTILQAGLFILLEFSSDEAKPAFFLCFLCFRMSNI